MEMPMLARALKVLSALLGAAAVLAAGAWAGGAFSRAQAAPGKPPRATDPLQYARATDGEVPIGDGLVVNGQPMQLSLFVTEDPPPRVVEYYRSAFAARRLLPIAHAGDQVGHVSVFDPEDGLQRFITAVPQPDGQTMVIVGVTNPRKAPRFTRAAAKMPFPVPDEQRGFLGYEAVDGAMRSQNGQFACSLSAPAVLAWYHQILAAQGYQHNPRESSEALGVFIKAGSSVTVAVQALEEKKGAMVFVNRIEGGDR
jgi:hypothetical protein